MFGDLSLTAILIKVLVLMTALPVHECAHAWAASKLGDNTARLQGRITLNPMKHLDLFGSVAMIFVGFGWAKPRITSYNVCYTKLLRSRYAEINGAMAFLLVSSLETLKFISFFGALSVVSIAITVPASGSIMLGFPANCEAASTVNVPLTTISSPTLRPSSIT